MLSPGKTPMSSRLWALSILSWSVRSSEIVLMFSSGTVCTSAS